jgi:hypothetical protein
MKPLPLACALGLTLLAQACASHRPSEEVTSQMARTEAILQQAERSGAGRSSLAELEQAKDKYARARTQLEKKSEEGDRQALALAKQAEVDAQYASARTQSTSQEAAADQVQSGVETLRREKAREAQSAPSAQ